MGEDEPLVGKVLQDTYRIEELIGKGGMGTVYRATHLRITRNFAVKMLCPEVAEQADSLARFKREAMITSSLGHPHILEVLDFNTTPEGKPYIIMEFLEGEDLAARMERHEGRGIGLERVASILKQTSSALQAAHDKGIVHRDLKPQNIYLCSAGGDDDYVKVVDFGVSKIQGSTSNLTKSNALLGTPFYMAPEQADQKAELVDARTDIYSLGTILYEMLAGKRPITGRSIPVLLYRIVHLNPPSLCSQIPDLSESISRVVARALSKRREERPESMDQLWAEFSVALEEQRAEAAAVTSSPGDGGSLRSDHVGLRVGNYVLKELLGEGGMGSVYLAEHLEIGRQLAVKILAPHLLSNRTAADRFLSEAKAVARIEHPNVIDIFDFGRLADGRPYCVMEKLTGQELKSVLDERGKLSAAEALPYLQQICAALQAAHDAGIIHRDLKPENIFVLDRSPLKLKVLDFGIAKLLETPHEKSLTSTGMVIGTPLFIAPEQAAAEPDKICSQTDIYSLGVILYLMLTGRPPFNSETPALLLGMHITDPPPPLREQNDSIPLPVAEVVERCLSKAPSSRPASATEVAETYAAALEAAALEPEIEQLVGDEVHRADSPMKTKPSQTTLSESVGEVAREERGRPSLPLRRSWIAVVAGLVVAAAALVLLLVGDRKDNRTDPALTATGNVRPDTLPRGAVGHDTNPRRAAAGHDAGLPRAAAGHDTGPPRSIAGHDTHASTRQVWLVTRPPGAAASWDGKPLGQTPLRGVAISTRSGSLVIKKPGFKKLRRPVESGKEELRLGPLELQSEPAPPGVARMAKKRVTGRETRKAGARGSRRGVKTLLQVNTLHEGRPFSADVYLDGKKIGQAPLFLPGVSPGPHKVEARRAGYKSASRQVRLYPGQEISVVLELRR